MTHEDLIRLQETNNKAIISVREMLGGLPLEKADDETVRLLELLLYTQKRIENDIAAVSHGVHV
jgi:hypothetical protein